MTSTIHVLIESVDREPRKGSLQALAAAQTLAARTGARVVPVALGSSAAHVAEVLGRYGVAEVLTAADAGFDTYLAEAWLASLAPAFAGRGPTTILAGASGLSRDLLPRLAQKLGAAYLGDVTGLGGDGANIQWKRPIYAGKATETVELLGASAILTLRPNTFPLPAENPVTPTVADLGAAAPASAKSRLRRREAASGLDKVELTEAEVVVSGGIGVGGPEGYAPLKELCAVLNGALGASRAAVHAGWIDAEHQVGQTGKTVSPKLYLACGISGMIQHQAGMRTSKCIVAINTDKDAPIYQLAHYGVAADLHKVVPALTAELKKTLGR